MAEDDLQECWRDVSAAPRPRVYRGVRNLSLGVCRVTVLRGKRATSLPLFLSEVKHSPTGFEWAYSGSGPAQLAYAILRDTLGAVQKDRCVELYQRFKAAVIAKLPQNEWTLTTDQVLDAVARLEGPGKGGDRGG